MAKWSENIEQVLLDIGDSCQGYKWMNIFSAQRENLKYNVLMYVIIFGTGICGILSTISSQEYRDILAIFVTTGTFMSSLASSIIKFAKMEQKAVSHKNLAGKFASLEANIRRQLSLERSERENAGQYLDYVTKSFDELFSATPLMSDTIYNKWIVFAKSKNLQNPKELCRTVFERDKDKKVVIEVAEDKKEEKDEKNEKKEEKEYHGPPPVSGLIPEVNTFSDAKMQYELGRFFRK
jgi:hypothetical protein